MASLSQLPLEIRRQIYRHYFNDATIFHYKLCRCILDPPSDEPIRPCGSWAIAQAGSWLRQEFREFLAETPLHISHHPDKALLKTSLPCLNFIGAVRISDLRITLDLFHLVSRISHVFNLLIRVCQFLRRRSHVSKLRIVVDGRIPSSQSPFVSDLELEHGTLVAALWLQPFTMLGNVWNPCAEILGGPCSSPWSELLAIQEYVVYVEESMRNTNEQVELCREQVLNLRDLLLETGIFWKLLSRRELSMNCIKSKFKLDSDSMMELRNCE